jgi:hypothetical protein
MHICFLCFTRRDFKNRARSLEYLSGIITDLFVDWSRLHGMDSRSKIGDLQAVILANDFDALVEAFLGPHGAAEATMSGSDRRK